MIYLFCSIGSFVVGAFLGYIFKTRRSKYVKYNKDDYYYYGYLLQRPGDGKMWFLVKDDYIVAWNIDEKKLLEYVNAQVKK